MNLMLFFLLSSGGSVSNATEWKVFKNKYQWEISIPKCWQAEGIEDVPAVDSPSVGFSPGKDCNLNEMKRYVSVYSNLMVKMRPPKTTLESRMHVARLNKYNAKAGEKKIGNAKMPTYFSIDPSTQYSPKSFVSISFTNCDNKNTSIAANMEISYEPKSIDEINLTPELERIVSSFVCKNPSGPHTYGK